MEKSILIIICMVITLSVAFHVYNKCCKCLSNGKTMIEDDTVKNC